jgi:biopolymer transport protein ExbD
MGFQTEGAGHRSAINVTPLIDVLLVLLIIFLVAMPLMLRMMRVEVPPKVEGVDPPPGGPPIVIKVHADLTLAVDDDRGQHEIALEELPSLVAKQKTRAVFVDFDAGIPWNLAVSTFDSIRSVARDTNHDEVRVLLRMRDE